MSDQLVLYKNDNSERQLMISALCDTRVAAAPIEDLAMVVSKAIEKGIFYLGLINKSAPDREALKMMVMEDCQTSFITLTLSEVKNAIENGFRGKYGDVRGMAPKDVYNWLKAYKNDPMRNTVRLELEAASQDMSEPPTEEEQIAIATYNLNNAWNTFKQKGYFTDHGNVIYNILDANGKIPFTLEDKERLWKLAKGQLINYHAPEKHFGNEVKMKEAMAITNSIKSEDAKHRIKSEAKQIAVNEFFARLVKDGIELWDIFKTDL